jgi:hypothetical protein
MGGRPSLRGVHEVYLSFIWGVLSCEHRAVSEWVTHKHWGKDTCLEIHSISILQSVMGSMGIIHVMYFIGN